MTNSMIPYSFTPGTKAKAQEVNANFIALAEKIDENNKNIVHDIDSSIISGQKTFTSPIYSTGVQSVTRGNLTVTNISDNKTTDAVISLNDSNVRTGSLRFTNGEGYTDTSLTSADETGDTIQSMGLRNTNGTAYGYAPTYTANYADTSTKIVTTAYMASHWTTTNATTESTASKARPAVVIQNYKNGTSWYRVWSDGWIEQGGLIGTNSNANQWLGFPRAFSNTNYVFVSAADGYNSKANIGITGKQTTGVVFDNEYSSNYNWYVCGY